MSYNISVHFEGTNRTVICSSSQVKLVGCARALFNFEPEISIVTQPFFCRLYQTGTYKFTRTRDFILLPKTFNLNLWIPETFKQSVTMILSWLIFFPAVIFSQYVRKIYSTVLFKILYFHLHCRAEGQ